MSSWAELNTRMQALQVAGAEKLAPAPWQHLHTLSARAAGQPQSVQALLLSKAQAAAQSLEADLASRPAPAQDRPEPIPTPSPMALLLADMRPQHPQAESPRVQQFRQDLRKITVQEKVRTALSKAPLNAGPINSHMLVLRALEHMRTRSPEYLQRFVSYVDTLALLEGLTPATTAGKRGTSSKRKTSA